METRPQLTVHAEYNGGHEVFVAPPNPEATIWRYVDFTKLVSLLDTQRLFFAPTTDFDDPFEGSYTVPNLASREEFWKKALPESGPPIDFAELARGVRQWVFTSCWSMSEVESAAFWGLYVPPQGGVAIRSTHRRLTESFGAVTNVSGENVESVFVGQVEYMDYEADVIPEGNLFYPFVHKRKSFEFESELRAVIMKFPESQENDDERSAVDFDQPAPAGLSVAVDLGILIDAIHISPSAPPWFADLVRSLVDRYECSATVRQSRLSATPVF